MDTLDPLQQWNELSEVYRSKCDGELEIIADTANELTDLARQALQAEISTRGLQLQLRDAPLPKETSPDPGVDPVHYEDRDVSAPTWVGKAENFPEAQEAKGLLLDAGITSYFAEDTTDPDFVPSDLSDGVDLYVPWADAERATLLLHHWMPTTDRSVEPGEIASPVLCPNCKSDEIVLLRTIKSPDHDSKKSKFKWHCEACSHTWIDDGVEEAK